MGNERKSKTYNDFVITNDGIETVSNSYHCRTCKLLAESFLNDGISSEAEFVTIDYCVVFSEIYITDFSTVTGSFKSLY